MTIGQLGRVGLIGLARNKGVRPRATPLRVATFGDSYADFSSYATTDVSEWNLAIGGGTKQAYRLQEKLDVAYRYRQAAAVACGGIGGQTTASMLARSGLGASSTRRAKEDVVALTPDVVFVGSAGINDLIAGTAVATVVANVKQIIDYFADLNIKVICCGNHGYSAATNTAAVRAALLDVNAQLAAYSRSNYVFASLLGITHDATGAYITGVSSDGVHINGYGAALVGEVQRQALLRLFGAPMGSRYPGTNLIPNADLSGSASQSYGIEGTNWACGATNATRDNAKVETINGITYQTCEFTPTSDNAAARIYTPFSVHGASPRIAVVAGERYGFEYDCIVQPLSGVALPGMTITTRVTLVNGSDQNIYSALQMSASAAFQSPRDDHLGYEPITMPANSAGLTSSSWSIMATFGLSGDRTPIKLGLGNPRMVWLG